MTVLSVPNIWLLIISQLLIIDLLIDVSLLIAEFTYYWVQCIVKWIKINAIASFYP